MSTTNEVNNITSSTPEEEMVGESTTLSTKKRRVIDPRSSVWDHFTKFDDAEGKKKAKCNYCGKVYASDPKKNGTSSHLNRLTSCKKHPCSEDLRQSQLSLQSISTRGGDNENIIGSLNTWRFDQEECRKALASMIVTDELPFSHVDGSGFKKFMATCCPRFKIPSRWTMSRDANRLYETEKVKLRDFFKKSGQNLCITTDSWTSIRQCSFMCITAHFIDKDWKLHKKIINFRAFSSHKGDDMGREIDICLREWGVPKLFAVTVDNAASNNTSINHLKTSLTTRGCAFLEGKYIHMRCAAHILNLIVGEGLKLINPAIKRVRDAVRFVRNSSSRLRRFKECCVIENIESKSLLCLDVPTRWNSTYLMLKVALKFEKAFEWYELEDPAFKYDLPDGVPTYSDWENAKSVIEILSTFYDLTLKFSGSSYVTSNLFAQEVVTLSCLLTEWMKSSDDNVRGIGELMKAKYDKYWGKDNMNRLVYVAVALDPRFKFGFVKYALTLEYGEKDGLVAAERIMESLKELFEAYKVTYHSRGDAPIQDKGQSSSESSRKIINVADQYMKNKLESGDASNKNDLDLYFEERDEIVKDMGKFDILKWWKKEEDKFPILSLLARDVLAIPISTVASESAFSAGGRILDPFRSSLTPQIVETLICTQDWFREGELISIEETLESLQKHQEGMESEVGGSE